MSFFKTKVPPKEEKEQSQHPWDKFIKDSYSNTYKYGHNSAENRPYLPYNKGKEELEPKHRTKLTVIGNRVTKEFIYCYYLVKGLHKYKKKKFEAPIIRGVTGVEWPKVWNDLKIQYGGKVHCLQSQVAVIVNDEFLGGENELKKFVESKYIYGLCLDYYNEGIQQFANFIKSTGKPCAYMHISINGEEIGSLIFMLYADIVPRTCVNFLRLCEATKGGYAGTPVHRIVKDCWIQCGGFGLANSPELECENFNVLHDRRGVLCMTNDGRHVDCSTQFFVLLQPAPWMEHKYVAFGQLIDGEKTLSRIESVPTWYESPTQEIMMYKTGVFNMECQYTPINNNTNAYIQGHIEDICELGELIYKELLERVFKQINENGFEEISEEGSVQNIHATKRFMREKGENRDSDTTSRDYVNNDYDVEEYDYEDEHYSYKQVSEPSTVIKPVKPYYIPLTDVMYPGEIDSEFNLKRHLRGYYCYPIDLENNHIKSKHTLADSRRLTIPEELLGAVFEYFTFGDLDYDGSTESSLDFSDKEIIDKYVSDHIDQVSFAGPIIKQMANVHKKYELFDVEKNKTNKHRLLTDDELRILRIAIKEHESCRSKKVSISLVSSRLSHNKILRRPTGYIRKSDLENFGLDSETYEDLDEEEDDVCKRKLLNALEHEKLVAHRQEPHKLCGDVPRESVLARLFEEVTKTDVETGPTLKDYKPTLPRAEKASFTLITHSQTCSVLNETEKAKRFKFLGGRDSIHNALKLQHGSTIYRKVSSDYVRTINRLEQKRKDSLRSLEYSRIRPTITVAQYKLKNKLYHENLKLLRKHN